jgi:hypothetical protein
MSTFSKTAMAQCFLAAACLLIVLVAHVSADDQVWTTNVNGVISEMRSGLIMVTMSWGTMTMKGERTFAVQHGDSKLSGMKEGTPIIIELNEAGNVIEIQKAG